MNELVRILRPGGYLLISTHGEYYLSQTGMNFLEGSPVFAVEIRSENDCGSAAEKALARKRSDYFAAGTRIVWDVDLLSDEVIRVYRARSSGTPDQISPRRKC